MKNVEARRSQTLTVLAPAKLNLVLRILGKRADSYHDLFTLFQSIDLCDRLHFNFTDSDRDEVNIKLEDSSTGGDFPLDDTNIIKKAALLYMRELTERVPVRLTVRVEKNIPIGAGLAGGSANAAATLSAINHHYKNKLSSDQLLQLAGEIGSDVPFSLLGGTSLGRGRGEILSSLPAHTGLHFVLVKPRTLAVSTAWAYDSFDRTQSGEQLDEAILKDQAQKLNALLGEKNISAAANFFSNSFEPVVFERYPVLRSIKERLIDLGCLCAYMTGSGPTIYGLVRDFSQAKAIQSTIISDQEAKTSAFWYKNYGFPVDTWLTKSIDHGIKVIGDEENHHKN
jgi:4-diphosphocytidyl-2-C-methyl-D-erythritol kinase